MNLQGKIALITGASRGIGRAISLEFARQHLQCLILVARNTERLAEVAAEVETLGAQAVVLPLDLTQPIEVNVAVAHAWRNYGPIDLLVNCAGVSYQTPFLQSHLPHVQSEIDTNLIGLYNITRLISRRMAAYQRGHIVNVSSLMGKVAAPTMATYSATKFAILGFSQALRGELAPYNVLVTTLLPSLTDTDMVRDFRRFHWVQPMTPEQVAKALVKGLRWGVPEILVGWQTLLTVWCGRLAPSLLERIVRWSTPSPRVGKPSKLRTHPIIDDR
ncbi:MAG: SDR family NAD(P)-dependent oxidoreductase [Leptolyngbyaceae cyanobacterium MO_188.B28]|nr:SDR family NAD(P)-dependent oxidoreductase [Leptolyngbyaceae cyanobacterium MO_188.B28]